MRPLSTLAVAATATGGNSRPPPRAIADQFARCWRRFFRGAASRSKSGPGTGEHIVCFAKALPGLLWQPSDPDPASRASIAAWIAAEGLANVRTPAAIDVRQAAWGVEDEAPFAAVVSLNMIHIAPWESGLGLLAGAGRLLRPDGVFYLYGPFMRGGAHTAPSNATFDADLKRRDPRWGVRDTDDLVREAAPHGLGLREVVDMPANNLSLVFVKSGPIL